MATNAGPDHPGAVGALAALRQGVAVVSSRIGGTPFAATCTDFTVSGLDDGEDGADDGGGHVPVDGLLGCSVGRRRCVVTLPVALAQGALAAVHVMDANAHGIAFHFLPPRRPQLGSGGAIAHLTAALQGVTAGQWPLSLATAGDPVDAGPAADVPEVPQWRCCLLCRVLTSAALSPRQHVTLLEVARVIAAPPAEADPEAEAEAGADGPARKLGTGVTRAALFVSAWQAREELLVEAFRHRTLLGADWGHEARLILCWWYARKFGRDRALPLLRAGVRSMLRAQGQEHLFNATADAAVLHLVAHAMYTKGHLASFSDFAAACPELADDPNVLDRYYSPQMLASRAARVAAMPPDRTSLPGPAPLSSSIRDALQRDGPLLPEYERVDTLRDQARAGMMTALPLRDPEAVPPGLDQIRIDDSVEEERPQFDRKVFGGRREGSKERSWRAGRTVS